MSSAVRQKVAKQLSAGCLQDACELLGVKKQTLSFQCDGLVERYNHILKTALYSMIRDANE